MKKWKKKYEKTSPKKIVSLVLKHLKNKMKKGDLNSSMSSNEHEEVPVPKKQLKKKSRQLIYLCRLNFHNHADYLFHCMKSLSKKQCSYGNSRNYLISSAQIKRTW